MRIKHVVPGQTQRVVCSSGMRVHQQVCIDVCLIAFHFPHSFHGSLLTVSPGTTGKSGAIGGSDAASSISTRDTTGL